jgi:hypothetical protein
MNNLEQEGLIAYFPLWRMAQNMIKEPEETADGPDLMYSEAQQVVRF